MLKSYSENTFMFTKYIKFIFVVLVLIIVLQTQTIAQERGDYNSVIKSADEYYQKKDYYNAKATYQLAVKLKPEEKYPQDKINEIIDLLKAEMAVRGEYDEYIELADEAMTQKDYPVAITNYEKALALISYEAHPKEALEKAKNLLDANQMKKGIYEEAIKTADQFFVEKDYEKALSFYRDAANVDANQQYPNEQIVKITNILQKQNADQLAFEQAITKGDQQLNYQKFSEALEQYESALSIKSEDSYAKTQVAKMKDFIQKEKEYDKIAAKADELYVNKDFAAAKAEYQKAQLVLPEKTYALNMISKIDASLDKEQAALLKQEEAYRKNISEADQLFKEQKYQVAYSKYSKALEMKPNEAYPKTQMEEINILLATGYVELSCFVHEDNKGLFDSRIQLSQGGHVIETIEIGTNGRGKIKLELDKEYQIRFYKTDYIQKIFDVNTTLPRDVNHNNIYSYDPVVELFPSCATDLSILDRPLIEITYYPEKGNFFVDEQRAQIMINRVNELKKECKEILEKEANKKEYDKAIAKADKFFEQKNYTSAIENYTAAGTLMPSQEYPKQRLTEIQAILDAGDKYQALITSGDAKYKAKDYENALYDYYAAKNLKPNEVYPPQKIAEIDAIINAQKALDASYLAQIKQADSLFQLDSLSMAKDSYQLALGIKAQEAYPQNQIKAIDQELSRRKELDKRYQDAIKNADKLFADQKLSDARSAYLVASQMKPEEMYPKYKIEDIDTIEEQRKMLALDNNYASVLAEADQLFEKKKYQEALPLYSRAAEIKPNESYPTAQIEIINGLLAKLKADQEQYDKLIVLADQQLASLEYAPAFDNYKAASQIKIDEQYPKDKMAEIEAMMKKLADLELAYQEAIRQADAHYASQSWNPALSSYQQASNLKPAEAYPIERIAEINAKLQGMADQDANYAAAIAEADAKFTCKEWTLSLTAYQNALTIKPNEAYPQGRIAEINQILKDLADVQAAYEAAIAQADALFSSKTYLEAKTKYQQANSIKPEETYPPQRISEIDGLLKQMADQDALYNELIKSGDALFAEKNYSSALGQFQQANQIKPQESYPPQKIAEIEALLKNMADQEAAYAKAIADADAFYQSQSWQESYNNYQIASQIKTAEQYPKDRMAEIEGILKDLAAQQEKQAAYDAVIAQADLLFDSKTYVDSKAKYQQAQTILPNESYPPQRIAEIEALLKQMADQDALYAQLIKSGDASFAQKSYESSLDQFKQANQIKPTEAYPTQKIAEIEALLLKIAENNRLYTEAIAEADKSRDVQAYPLAITKYQEAANLKPEEKYPPEQIGLIQKLMGDLAQQQADYDAAIAAADQEYGQQQWQAALVLYQQAFSIKPSETYPKEKIQEIELLLKQLAEKDAAYTKAIADADGFYKNKAWQESLSNYQLASQIKEEEKYPKDKIAELTSLLGEMAATNAKYDGLIAEADLLFASKDFVNSRNKYQEASEVKAQESYPKEKIKEIDALLAQMAALQKQYDDLIKEADQLFAKENWQPSLEKYQAALQIKTEEVYPKGQVDIINAKLQAIANLKASYDALIAEADQLFGTKEYESSLLKYEAATQILVEEKYPKDQMKIIRDILADLAKKNAEYDKIITKADDLLIQESYEKSKDEYKNALMIFAERPYPQEQITKIDGLIAQRDQYNQLISAADNSLKERQYEDALSSYQQALALMPTQEYPQKKISEVQSILQAIAETRAAYEEAVRMGDQNLDASRYEEAKTSYQLALSHISTEVYPRQKIMEIDQILQDLARKRMQYDKVIAQANTAFDGKSYDMALSKYKEALVIIPTEAYPQKRIEEINTILAQMANQQERYESLVAQGDQAFNTKEFKSSIGLFEQAQAIFPNEIYPPQKIAEAKAELEKIQRELDVAYQKAINEGDKNFKSKTWDPAKLSYQEASDIKPNELYPKEKLAEINSILEKELKKQQQEYDRYIADGERFYSTKYYQEAILSFEKALAVFPFEKYPSEMIDKIFELIKKNSMVTLLDGKMTIAQNKEEKFNFNTISFKDRSENYILLEIKMVNPEAQVKLFVNFGKGGSQNGGYSIPLKNRDGYHSYFVSIGKQVRWVNQDNDYISLLPEGGDVEVKLIKISRNGI